MQAEERAQGIGEGSDSEEWMLEEVRELQFLLNVLLSLFQ